MHVSVLSIYTSELVISAALWEYVTRRDGRTRQARVADRHAGLLGCLGKRPS
jgi:hypothetical protein